MAGNLVGAPPARPNLPLWMRERGWPCVPCWTATWLFVVSANRLQALDCKYHGARMTPGQVTAADHVMIDVAVHDLIAVVLAHRAIQAPPVLPGAGSNRLAARFQQ